MSEDHWSGPIKSAWSRSCAPRRRDIFRPIGRYRSISSLLKARLRKRARPLDLVSRRVFGPRPAQRVRGTKSYTLQQREADRERALAPEIWTRRDVNVLLNRSQSRVHEIGGRAGRKEFAKFLRAPLLRPNFRKPLPNASFQGPGALVGSWLLANGLQSTTSHRAFGPGGKGAR